MGANDDILADGSGTDGADKASDPSQKSNNSVDSAAVADAVRAGLADFGPKLDQFAGAIGKHVQQALAGAQQAQATGNANASQTDLAQRVLTDPEGTIRGMIDEWAKVNLAPHLSTQVADRYEELLDRQRSLVDKRWGDGAFDSIVRSEVEQVVEKTPNAAAKASQQFIAAAVSGCIGRDSVLDKLQAHRDAAKVKEDAKAKELDDMDTGVFDAGRPRRRGAKQGELTAEEQEFLKEHSKITGVTHNPKKLAEIMAMKQRSGFLDSQNMPGVKNKLPIKGSRHRQATT